MKIYQFESSVDTKPLGDLIREYLEWAGAKLESEQGLIVDSNTIDAMIENDLKTIDKFMPPAGRLLLGEIDNELAGMACLRKLEENIGEVKRMYVRPQFRRMGLARTLFQSLLYEAKAMDCSILLLDSARFMSNAQQLYSSMGFREINPYEVSEVPKDIQNYWIFMELSLEESSTGN